MPMNCVIAQDLNNSNFKAIHINFSYFVKNNNEIIVFSQLFFQGCHIIGLDLLFILFQHTQSFKKTQNNNQQSCPKQLWTSSPWSGKQYWRPLYNATPPSQLNFYPRMIFSWPFVFLKKLRKLILGCWKYHYVFENLPFLIFFGIKT